LVPKFGAKFGVLSKKKEKKELKKCGLILTPNSWHSKIQKKEKLEDAN